MAGRLRNGCLLSVTLMLLVFYSVPCFSVVYHVTTNGNDDNDGLTWETAKLHVQEALDVAQESDEVWVAVGTYVENITLKDGVKLYGGFSGTEDDTTESYSVRLLDPYATVLDGNHLGSVVTAPRGVTNSTVIDGFTIVNGSGTTVDEVNVGGGIFCKKSSPIIRGNTILENTADAGGGIFCRGGSPMIRDNSISNNEAAIGGGICFFRSHSRAIHNLIADNISEMGGGICAFRNAEGEDSTTKNKPRIRIRGNEIVRNSAGMGGGILTLFTNTIINDNAIGDNRAEVGAGIFCIYGEAPISGNLIERNAADYQGGGILSMESTSPIANNLIVGNSALYAGGGVRCWFSSSAISNNTIVENEADEGGAIYCSLGSEAAISNNIIALCSSGICVEDSPNTTLSHNCLYDNNHNYLGLLHGTTDIYGDPLFVDSADSDYRLSFDSPCVDAGDDGAVLPGWPDFEGQPRIQGKHVDIGAYEYPEVTVKITSPTNGPSYATCFSTINLMGYASSPKHIAGAVWFNDRGGWGMCTGTKNWRATGIHLAPGKNTITVSAWDSIESWNSDTLIVTFTDKAKPFVEFTSPATGGNYVTYERKLNIAGWAVDDCDVAQITWTNDCGGSGICDGTTSWSADEIQLSPGRNRINVKAIDSSGNHNEAILMVVCMK